MPVPTGTMSETGSGNATDGAMQTSNSSSSNNTIVPNPTDLGKRVVAFSAQGRKEQYYGTLRFCGKSEFAEGVWCGIELDDPDGKNNGSVQGIRYFSCEAGYGVFVPLSRVELDVSRRSRVRPRNKPGSRPSSRDRGDHKPGSASIPSSPAKTRASNVPREMAMKLSTPGTLDRYQYSKKGSLQPAGKPMKAVGTEYGSYGLKKCTSEMNIRGQLVDSANGTTNQAPRFLRPQHKRGSMGDLKSAASLSGPPSPAHGKDTWEGAGLRGANSLGNLAFPKQSTTEIKISPPANKKQSREAQRHHSHSEMLWPRTSSPNSSDQQDTDCFEDASSDSDRTPRSSSASPTSPTNFDFSSNMFGVTGGLGAPLYNQAFLAAPGTSLGKTDTAYGSRTSSNSHKQSSCSRHIPIPQGLVTQAIQLIEKSRKDSDGPCRVPSPESQKTGGRRFRNRRSGTATLAHPLSSAHGNDRSSPDSSSSSNTSVGDPSEIFVCPTSGQQIPVSTGSTSINGAQEVWYQQLNRRQVMLEERLVSMEALLKQTQADLQSQKEFFLKQMEEAQDKFKKQMEDAQSKHRTEIRQLCMALLNHSE